MSRSRLLVSALLVTAIAVFVVFDLGRFLSLAFFESQRASLAAVYAAHPWQTAAAYMAIYVTVAALSLPGAAIMTLAGGALFGFLVGTVLVSFASSIGAT